MMITFMQWWHFLTNSLESPISPTNFLLFSFPCWEFLPRFFLAKDCMVRRQDFMLLWFIFLWFLGLLLCIHWKILFLNTAFVYLRDTGHSDPRFLFEVKVLFEKVSQLLKETDINDWNTVNSCSNCQAAIEQWEAKETSD